MDDLRMVPRSNEAPTINPDRLPFISNSEPSAPSFDDNATTAPIVGWNTSLISKPPLPYPPSLSYPQPTLTYPPQYESTPAVCFTTLMMLIRMLISHASQPYRYNRNY